MTTETTTKERPILFNGAMVRAILDGSKTQMRRVVKPQPEDGQLIEGAKYEYDGFMGDCPFGVPGDRLWVREDMYYTGDLKHLKSVRFTYRADCDDLKLTASMRKRMFAQHMPKRWSRITLETTDFRVERLQEITNDDAQAEGTPVSEAYRGLRYVGSGAWSSDQSKGMSWGPRACFAGLWDSINAKTYPWDSNPWVWVVTFKQIKEAR